MRAVTIVPREPGSLRVQHVPAPSLDDVADGRGVRVRIIRVGLCGTDADLVRGEYGYAPDGADHLILGHESFGQVVDVGPAVGKEFEPGQFVVVTVRRPGSSPYDRIGRPDLSTDAIPTEAGISKAHGFMAETVVVAPDALVAVPEDIADVAVLTEPLSCIVKALRQADQVQARLGLWEPQRALVTGAGTIGLLATLVLRTRGIDVVTFARRQAPYRNSELVERTGARYASAADIDLAGLAGEVGGFDIVFEGAGAPSLVEPAVGALAPNGVLALFSVTPGSKAVELDMARLNQSMVLYNRVIVGSAAASWADYAGAVETIVGAESDPATRGWLGELITDHIQGFDAKAIERALLEDRNDIKTTVELGSLTTG